MLYIYEIRVEGKLDPCWAEWLGMDVRPLPDGGTLLSGRLPDQAALHGVLNRIRDMHLVLVSLQRKDSG